MSKARTRTLQHQLACIETWPNVLIDVLGDKDKELFLKRRKAIFMYADGESGVEIEKFTGLPSSEVIRLIKRCLKISRDGAVWGFRALIPKLHIKIYERKIAVECKLPESKGGCSGALGAVLTKYPELEEKLARLIFKKTGNRELHEHKIKAKSLHRIFLSELKAMGLSEREWPFNTKYLGYRTIATYMNTLILSSVYQSVHARETNTAIAHLGLGSGHAPILEFVEPFSCVEIDAHNMDARFCASFTNPDGLLTEVLLSRIWLIVIIDRASSAVLWFRIVYRSEISASDISSLISECLRRNLPKPAITIPELVNPDSAGFPSDLIPETNQAVWAVTMLDNALAHLSEKIAHEMRKVLGCAMNWGPVGHFERRPNVERTFHDVHTSIFSRFPSTTGSNPFNGKAENGEKLAVTFNINADHIDQILYYHFATHNATPSEGLYGLTPLEFIKKKLDMNDGHLLVRGFMKPKTLSADEDFSFKTILTARIGGSIKNGRTPYIQLDRVKYTSPVLREASLLIGSQVKIEVDERDMRQFNVYLLNGEPLGVVRALGKWGVVLHDRKTRKAINSLLAKRLLTVTSFDDPVQLYLNYLSSSKNKNKNSGNKKDAPLYYVPPDALPRLSPKSALEAKRVMNDAEKTVPALDFMEPAKPSVIENETYTNTFQPLDKKSLYRLI